jgi:hypothetical protein
LQTFKRVLMVSFTIDPKLFVRPDGSYDQPAAHRYVKEKRCIGEWMRSMRKAGYLESDRYFAALEFQMGQDGRPGTLMPHWHVLVDAYFIPQDVGQERWGLFRPAAAGSVEGRRPGFGTVDVKDFFASAEHAAHYAFKYLEKQPRKGWPEWVLDSKGEIKRCWVSKGFYGEEAEAEEPVSECNVDSGEMATIDAIREAEEADRRAEQGPMVLSTIRERISRCGYGVIVTEACEEPGKDGERVVTYKFVKKLGGVQMRDACKALLVAEPVGCRFVRLTAEQGRLLLDWYARGPRAAGQVVKAGEARWQAPGK